MRIYLPVAGEYIRDSQQRLGETLLRVRTHLPVALQNGCDLLSARYDCRTPTVSNRFAHSAWSAVCMVST